MGKFAEVVVRHAGNAGIQRNKVFSRLNREHGLHPQQVDRLRKASEQPLLILSPRLASFGGILDLTHISSVSQAEAVPSASTQPKAKGKLPTDAEFLEEKPLKEEGVPVGAGILGFYENEGLNTPSNMAELVASVIADIYSRAAQYDIPDRMLNTELGIAAAERINREADWITDGLATRIFPEARGVSEIGLLTGEGKLHLDTRPYDGTTELRPDLIFIVNLAKDLAKGDAQKEDKWNERLGRLFQGKARFDATLRQVTSTLPEINDRLQTEDPSFDREIFTSYIKAADRAFTHIGGLAVRLTTFRRGQTERFDWDLINLMAEIVFRKTMEEESGNSTDEISPMGTSAKVIHRQRGPRPKD